MIVNLPHHITYHCKPQDGLREFQYHGTLFVCSGCGWRLHPLTILTQMCTDDLTSPVDVYFTDYIKKRLDLTDV